MNPLWDLLESATAESPHAPAILTETRTYSFEELHSIATNIARELRDRGLRPGDVVATVLPNAMDWMVILAAAHEGLLSVSLHHAGQAADIGAAIVLAVPERLTTKPDPSIPLVEVNDQWIRNCEGVADPTPMRQFDGAESLVRLVLTSGTTGNAKAAEYPVRKFAAITAEIETTFGHGGDVRLNFMGFSTNGALYQALGNLVLRTPYVAFSAISDRLPELIAELGITVMIGATTSLAQVCDAYDRHPEITPQLRRIAIAGSTAADSLLRRLSAQFPAAEFAFIYGSTEGGMITLKNAVVDSDPRIVGHVMPDVKLEILDAAGNLVPAGEVGEIRYWSKELTERYYRDPAATAAAIRDGWFYPGDRGKFVPSGELMLIGRVDDVINLAGVKVDPGSLESIALSVPGVDDAAAYLVHSDKGLPSIEMALVADSAETMHAVDAQMRDDPTRVVPATYRRVTSLPHNQMGKLVRHDIAAHIAELGE
jgi:acyl-CoA synthetase (AMP-forming)/AMP-acid ligase II